LTLPVSQYPHTGGNCSITGGFVYRGCAIPEINGVYFYADYCSAQIWSWRWNGAQAVDSMNRTADLTPDVGSIGGISSFGEDAYGELYICDISGGEIFKIIPDNLTDCNSNTIADSCDIISGFSDDANENGVPDECETFPCDSVTNLTVNANEESDAVTLYWTANGDGSETYTVWRSYASQVLFPDAWEVIADNLPHMNGINAMSYTDTIAESDTLQFYLVTAECP
jgi:hypothetical protein